MKKTLSPSAFPSSSPESKLVTNIYRASNNSNVSIHGIDGKVIDNLVSFFQTEFEFLHSEIKFLRELLDEMNKKENSVAV